jgi:hypothetical protein
MPTQHTLVAACTLGALALLPLACAGGAVPRPITASKADGLAAFATVQRVLQHPRCQNCHPAGDVPLQFDDGRPHGQLVVRGADGHGAVAMRCANCHGEQNPPAGYGPHAPPGAPHWHLPPKKTPMVFEGKSAAELARTLADPAQNGGKSLDALLEHVSKDALVLWGWQPGGERAPVPVPHAEFVAAFKVWIDAGAPSGM